MERLRVYCFMLVIFSILSGCKKDAKNPETSAITSTTASPKVFGNYVTADYAKRDEGYDWVAVSVTKAEKDDLTIAIRSRADKKKPTCTFEGKAVINADGDYEVLYEGTKIQFKFTESNVSISTKDPDDLNLLYYFCSGGATLAGTYQKIEGELENSK